MNELVNTANIDLLGGTSVLSGIAVEARMALGSWEERTLGSNEVDIAGETEALH